MHAKNKKNWKSNQLSYVNGTLSLFSPCLGKSFYSFHSIVNYSKSFNFLILQTISFHSIFFSIFFFNFLNPYTTSLNLNYLYHLKIHKVKLFNIIFFSNHSKSFSNHFDNSNKWNGMTKMVCPNTNIFYISMSYWTMCTTYSCSWKKKTKKKRKLEFMIKGFNLLCWHNNLICLSINTYI